MLCSPGATNSNLKQQITGTPQSDALIASGERYEQTEGREATKSKTKFKKKQKQEESERLSREVLYTFRA